MQSNSTGRQDMRVEENTVAPGSSHDMIVEEVQSIVSPSSSFSRNVSIICVVFFFCVCNFVV